MKNRIILFSLIVLISACKQNKGKFVKDYLKNTNSNNKEESEKQLADDFTYTENGKPLNKKEYLKRVDSLKSIENRIDIISTKDNDSIVKTEEKHTTIIDSLLEIKSKVYHKTYSFKDGKLKNINVDSIKDDSTENDKLDPFIFYIKNQHDISDAGDIFKNIKKYLMEYYGISNSEKKKYKTISYLQGTFISETGLYGKLEFKGKHSVIVYCFGVWPIAENYTVDEDYISIEAKESNLLLQVKDRNTLIGEGFAVGVYKKQKEN